MTNQIDEQDDALDAYIGRNTLDGDYGEPMANQPTELRCTWVDCTSNAAHPQIAQDQSIWANLCDDHNQQLDTALNSIDPKVLLSVWVKAQGGAKRAAQRTLGDL